MDSIIHHFNRLARLAGRKEQQNAEQMERLYRRRIKRRYAELGEDSLGTQIWDPSPESVDVDSRDSQEYLYSLKQLEDRLVKKLRWPL